MSERTTSMARYHVHMSLINWVCGYDYRGGRPVRMSGQASYGIQDTQTQLGVPPVIPPLGYGTSGFVDLEGPIFPVEEIRPSFEKAVLAREPILTADVEFFWIDP
jgi:hypothetical protein